MGGIQCFLLILVIYKGYTEGVLGELSVTTRYKTDYQCNNGPDVVIRGQRIYLLCEYGLQRSQLEAVEWTKNRYTATLIFAYMNKTGIMVFTEYLKDRAIAEFSDYGLNLTILNATKLDNDEYQCWVETQTENEDTFLEIPEVHDPPGKSLLTNLMTVVVMEMPSMKMVDKTITIDGDFNEIKFIVVTSPVQKIKCDHPTKVTLSLRLDDGGKDVRNDVCSTHFSSYDSHSIFYCIVSKHDLMEDKVYVISMYAEQFGVLSDPVSYTVQYLPPTSLLWLLWIPLVVILVVAVCCVCRRGQVAKTANGSKGHQAFPMATVQNSGPQRMEQEVSDRPKRSRSALIDIL